MARYPDLPYLINVTQEETRKVYKALEKWGAGLVIQLDLRDQDFSKGSKYREDLLNKFQPIIDFINESHRDIKIERY